MIIRFRDCTQTILGRAMYYLVTLLKKSNVFPHFSTLCKRTAAFNQFPSQYKEKKLKKRYL